MFDAFIARLQDLWMIWTRQSIGVVDADVWSGVS